MFLHTLKTAVLTTLISFYGCLVPHQRQDFLQTIHFGQVEDLGCNVWCHGLHRIRSCRRGRINKPRRISSRWLARLQEFCVQAGQGACRKRGLHVFTSNKPWQTCCFAASICTFVVITFYNMLVMTLMVKENVYSNSISTVYTAIMSGENVCVFTATSATINSIPWHQTTRGSRFRGYGKTNSRLWKNKPETMEKQTRDWRVRSRNIIGIRIGGCPWKRGPTLASFIVMYAVQNLKQRF